MNASELGTTLEHAKRLARAVSQDCVARGFRIAALSAIAVLPSPRIDIGSVEEEAA